MTETARQESSALAWRQRLSRFSGSGQTVKAFCEQESVSTYSFYHWRRRLQQSVGGLESPAAAGAFVDLGAVTATGASADPNTPDGEPRAADFAIRLDLPGGIVLTIARG